MHFLTSLKRHLLPGSIFGRFLLIIILPAILAQIIAIYMFYERHWDNVSRHLQTALAGEMAAAVDNINNADSLSREVLLQQTRRLFRLEALFFQDLQLPSSYKPLKDYPIFTSLLRSYLTHPYHIYYSANTEQVILDVQLPEGILKITASRKRLVNATTYIFIMWMTGTGLLLLIISVVFMRNQLRPIIRLARAADKYGRGQNIKSFKPEGATEIRKAAEAFWDMKERIDRQVSQRTEMLAGVSHDLRTPLTRMKLQLALMPESTERQELERDTQDMEAMIQAYLDFAKNNDDNGIIEPIDVAEQIKYIAGRYPDSAHSIQIDVKNNMNITISVSAFRRIISNIIDNALRYASLVTITIDATDKHVILTLDDNGPGIPEDKRKDVFKPFYRLDTSRNSQTGGTGLGLSVVRDLVARYGGEIFLAESPLKGLRVHIRFPK